MFYAYMNKVHCSHQAGFYVTVVTRLIGAYGENRKNFIDRVDQDNTKACLTCA